MKKESAPVVDDQKETAVPIVAREIAQVVGLDQEHTLGEYLGDPKTLGEEKTALKTEDLTPAEKQTRLSTTQKFGDSYVDSGEPASVDDIEDADDAGPVDGPADVDTGNGDNGGDDDDSGDADATTPSTGTTTTTTTTDATTTTPTTDATTTTTTPSSDATTTDATDATTTTSDVTTPDATDASTATATTATTTTSASPAVLTSKRSKK
jgi:hypothetical protein